MAATQRGPAAIFRISSQPGRKTEGGQIERQKAKVCLTPVGRLQYDSVSRRLRPTLDGKHPVTKIFKVDLPMRVWVQVPCELLHLQAGDKGGRRRVIRHQTA